MEGGADRPGFRPDIEGLRAVAVLAVVLFHAGVPGLSGGFVGVDVFFVISGFLITGLLWREIEGTGRIRLARFYGARARRLLPAGMTVLVATAAGTAWLMPPLAARTFLGDGVASALYAGNYRLAVRGTDYLAADTAPSTFQHYWSLGVEEQFYLVWPALLIVTAALLHRRRSAGERPVAPYLAVLALICGISFAVSLRWTTTLPPWAFFALPARAWELAAGGLVALTAPWWRRIGTPAAVTAGIAGLVAVGVACVRLGGATPYPGTAALLPVLGTAVVLAAGCAAPRSGVGAVLALPPLRFVGRVSYSWYLWHWPVLQLAPHLLGHALDLPARLAAAGLSGVLAVLTLYLVENPVRFAGPLRRSGARSLAVGAAATAAGVCATLVAVALVPPPVGHGRAVAAPRLAAGTAASSAAPSESPEDAEIEALTAQVQAVVAASAHQGAVPSDLRPPLAHVGEDRPDAFGDGCFLGYLAVSQPGCAEGDTASRTTVLAVGDSHAAMWEPALASIATAQRWRLEVAAKTLCPLLDLPIRSPYLGRAYTECDQWRTAMLARIRAERPALVLLDMVRRYTPDYGFTVYGSQWLAALARTVAELRATGAAVLVLGPVPDPHGYVPGCLSEHLDAVAACDPDRGTAMNAVGIANEQRSVEGSGGRYADLTALFCTTTACPVVIGGMLVFRDDNHLTVEYVNWLTPVLSALLARALSPR